MTTGKEIRAEIIERIRRGGKVLIASHVNPDGDSIGSQLALYDLCHQLGAQPTIVSHDQVTSRYRFLSKYDLLEAYQKEKTYQDFDFAIVLEATELDRIGQVKKLLKPDTQIINIDHHPGNPAYGNINLIDESAAAAGVMIYLLFQEAGVEVSRDNADELFTAIVTDTGRFCFPNSNAEALEISARLIEAGAAPKSICEHLYSQYSEDQVRLLGELISHMELHHAGKTCFLVCSREVCSKYAPDASDMDGLVNYSLYTAGVQVGVLLREIEEKVTKVSLRSSDKIDVGALARRFNGGGHVNAAGCNIKLPLPEARAELLKNIGELVGS
jgi:phosphoesterase RecJ-like protein